MVKLNMWLFNLFKKKQPVHKHKYVYQEKAYRIDRTYLIPKYIGHAYRCDEDACGKLLITEAVPRGSNL